VLSPQFLRFLLVGGLAAGVNFLSRIGFSHYLDYRWAVFWAYLVGMLTAYLLSRLAVFEPSGKHPAHEMAWFVFVNLLALVQVWGISVGLAEYAFPALGFTWHPESTAHAIGLAVPAVTSYLGHKHLTFGKRSVRKSPPHSPDRD